MNPGPLTPPVYNEKRVIYWKQYKTQVEFFQYILLFSKVFFYKRVFQNFVQKMQELELFLDLNFKSPQALYSHKRQEIYINQSQF